MSTGQFGLYIENLSQNKMERETSVSSMFPQILKITSIYNNANYFVIIYKMLNNWNIKGSKEAYITL